MVEQQKSPIGRRAVAKGIAWSVPAVALATAAPALAVSPLIEFESNGKACKFPGGSVPGWDKTFLFPVLVHNRSNERVCITPTGSGIDYDKGGIDGGTASIWTDMPLVAGATQITPPLCIERGKSTPVWLVIDGAGNSGNQSGTAFIDFAVQGMDSGRQDVVRAQSRFDSTPPDCVGTSTVTSGGSNELKTAQTAEKSADSAPAEEEPAEDTATESAESSAADEPAASDGGGAEPAASDGGR